MTVYSETFKTKMVQRMLSPNGRTMRMLSRESGVPEPTLFRWRNRATLLGMPSSDDDEKPAATTSAHEWTAEQKLELVLEAAAVADANLGEFLRRKGVHEAQLREWRQQALGGLRGKPAPKTTGDDARRVRELERELQRKDKALAEAAALLLLKKKAQEIWGAEDDDTDPKSEK